MNPADKFWTEERIEEMRAFAKKGLTAAEIAERFGKTPGAVRSKAAHNSIRLNYATGRWTKAEEERLKAMHAEGMLLADMATALNRADPGVRHRLIKLGLRDGALRGPEKPKRRAAKPERPEPTQRRCLMCRDEFPSEWAGERVCGSCKGTAAWRSGENDYSVRA